MLYHTRVYTFKERKYEIRRLRNRVVLNTVVNTIEILAVKIHNGSGTVHLLVKKNGIFISKKNKIIAIVCTYASQIDLHPSPLARGFNYIFQRAFQGTTTCFVCVRREYQTCFMPDQRYLMGNYRPYYNGDHYYAQRTGRPGPDRTYI